ncbi:hypothetical protein CDAR_193911 [Caerostris darwini]|uniref:Short transient receptor potential channel 4-associated protein n=1 Tax=Caerostris darwini TaxID=1538125 RepID=A0AAV4U837_9ARAC|nr:hypothetical protein CDAR_193911 [Caerostris darwini]
MMNFNRRLSRFYSGNSILHTLSRTALHGEPCRSSFKNLHQTLKRLECYDALHLDNLLHVVKKLEETLLHWRPKKYDVLQLFWDLNHEINDLSKRSFDNDKRCRNSETAKLIRDLLLKHIIEVLQLFIASYTLLPKKAAGSNEIFELLELKGIALEILHTICIEFEDQVLNNVDQVDFVKCLFSYLQYDQTCFPACQVLESLILSKKNIYDLSKIEDLPTILMNLDDIQLGNFCKILAVTLSELDMYENKTLYAQTQQKKNKNTFIRDTNQDIILGIPNLLSRLVKIACALPYVPWSGAAAHSTLESEQWLSWIDTRFQREMASELRSDTFVGGVTLWSEYNSYGPPRISIKTTLELTFRADAMCVLGLLLIGRHRKEIQKELTDLRLIPQLSDLFDHFVWKTNARDSVRLPGHNTSCECSPEVALKIQILRLIHSYCDHSEYKYAMLSWCELSEITNIEELSEADYPTWLKPSAICSGSRGLLTKILDIIKKESGVSTFRFWLSRAIESYVRGNFHCADQDFLLRRNLLSHVVQSLLTSNSRHREILQSSFDLLGELIKFNVAAFTQLNSHILTSAKQKKLMSVMSASLVDSNMFIRNLILSYELFVCSGDSDLKVFAEECCNILSHVGKLKTRLYYLQKLLSLINIHNLTQENVSCLNTALVILISSFKKGELPQYLRFLSISTVGCSIAANNSVHLENLRELLLFWQDHYLQKDIDCSILEKGSKICFQEWKDTVSLLTSDDAENPCTIAFYALPSLPSRAS